MKKMLAIILTLVLVASITPSEHVHAAEKVSVQGAEYYEKSDNMNTIQPREVLTYEVVADTEDERFSVRATISVQDYGTSKKIVAVRNVRLHGWDLAVDYSTISVKLAGIEPDGSYALVTINYMQGGLLAESLAYIYP